jgi:hypothetical protein
MEEKQKKIALRLDLRERPGRLLASSCNASTIPASMAAGRRVHQSRRGNKKTA